MIKVPPYGPSSARILILGESPGVEEERRGEPFVGQAGQELTRMLHEAGILREECFITNVCKYRPPNNDIANYIVGMTTRTWMPKPPVQEGLQELEADILRIKPNVIIALGGVAMWALTDKKTITKWRGSTIWSDKYNCKIIPTYHPASVLHVWEWRSIAVHDFRRAKREAESPGPSEPKYNFILRPTLDQALHYVNTLIARANEQPLLLSVDIETRGGHTACVGIAPSKHDAICIPFMCAERREGYWSLEEELLVVDKMAELLAHTNVRVVGQNFLYDCQYFAADWGFVPNVHFDTMFAQGVLFPGMQKSLDFLSSMYCAHHLYWKDAGKEWDIRTMPEEQLWNYNCIDAVKTMEVYEVESALLDKLGLRDPFTHKMSEFYPVLTTMLHGVLIDQGARDQMDAELQQGLTKREEYFTFLLGHPLNPRSPKKMMQFFYDDLKLPVQKSRKTKKPTLDDEALQMLVKKEPIIWPLVDRISEYRSIGVYLSTFIRAELDPDGRMRCSFNPVGTETMRFSSSANAFYRGTNLQNIPKGDDPDAPENKDKEFTLPEVRRLFIPDAGKVILDWDLERADAQVVAWEAGDTDLMQMFRERADIHTESGKTIFQKSTVTGTERFIAKKFVHLTNYGGSSKTAAASCGLTVQQADRAQRIWFAAHPGIKAWHDRILLQLQQTRCVTNKFGYRRFYFDRIEGLLAQALAWVPQSTVACIINRGYVNLYTHMAKEVDILLQVHDSLVMQIAADLLHLIPQIKQHLLIPVPYEIPLTIDVNCKIGKESWGKLEKHEEDI